MEKIFVQEVPDEITGGLREIGKGFACLGKFAEGITVVTYQGSKGPTGLTVSLFVPVSLDPPIILISIEKFAKAYEELKNKPFTVNILHEEQEELALHFGGRTVDKLSIDWVQGETAPRLKESLAYLECSPWQYTDYGDHRQYIGKVECFSFSEKAPLIYFSGNFGRFIES